MSRPFLLNEEIQTAVCKALRAGNNRRASCAFGGICYSTMLNWIKLGDEAKRNRDEGVTLDDSKIPFIEFSGAVQKAEGLAEVEAVAVIQKAAREATSGQWTAAAWWLERKYPDNWGRRERRDHREGTSEKVQINVIGPATVEKE